MQEALNVFPPQNSNQPPGVILSEWPGCVCPFHHHSLRLLCTIQDCTDRVCCDPTSAVPTRATTGTHKYPPEISALGRLRNLPAWFLKKPRGSSVTYNDYIFACSYSSIFKKKWKQYVFYFLMLVTADSSKKVMMVTAFVLSISPSICQMQWTEVARHLKITKTVYVNELCKRLVCLCYCLRQSVCNAHICCASIIVHISKAFFIKALNIQIKS